MPVKRPHLIPLFVLAGILAGRPALHAELRISEFMVANTTSLADEDGEFSDWIEVFNPDAAAVNLNGWYLTDSATNKTKWQFPAVSLSPGGYLVVFASSKNRQDPAGRLHTNFALDADGEYLALVKADGTSVASEFSPKFPKQQDNVAFGYAPGTPPGSPVFLSKPTPGAANAGASPVGIPETVIFSQAAGPFRTPFSLALSGAGSGQQIRYVVVPGSVGATAPEPTATSTLYTGPITVASSTVVRAALFSTDGTTRGATRTIYYSMISSSLANFTSILPVLVIDSLGSGSLVKDGVDHTSWLYAYAPRTNNTPVFSAAPELASPLMATVRGSTSAEFPKKSYNTRFTDELGNGRAPTLLDLPSHEQWALVAPWKYDLSFFSSAFVYELSNRIGRWASRTRLAEVYFNANGNDIDSADYAGIYALTDRVEVGKKRVDLANLAPNELSGSDVTGGYILKIDAKDPDEIGWVTSRGIPNTWSASIVLVSPAADAIAPAQLAYIKDYVQRMEDALFASRDAGWAQRSYLDYLDRAAWVDHHLLNTFVANPDAFQRSAYFTKDRKGRLVAGPVWDFDRALGSYWDERSFRYDVWSGVGAADVWQTGWWGVIARDPEFMQDWVDRWQLLRRSEFATAKLVALVDLLGASVGAAAAARDVARWPDNASPYGTYAAQIERQRGWITRRAEWIDSQFVAPPTIANLNGLLTITPAPGTRLAYTTDGSDPRALGGGVASTATLASGAVTLSNALNLQARSYTANFNSSTFPGSPWSSRVGNPGRLINLSILTELAAGDNFTMGFVVGGAGTSGPKALLARAAGPSLAQLGVAAPHSDPNLEFFVGATKRNENDNWNGVTSISSAFAQVGAFAYVSPTSKDAAVFDPAVAQGNNSVVISGIGSASGTVIAELYDATSAATVGATTPRLINVSVLKRLGTGLTAGFVVGGGSARNVLIRAIGPTLGSAFGLTGEVDDPKLTLFGKDSTKIGENDDWGGTSALTAAFTAVGAFALPGGSRDAALLATLPPGSYTVQVSGDKAISGTALVEIYEVP